MHWRTTTTSIISAIATALAASGMLPAPWGLIASLVGAAALALLGGSAADKKVTNGNGTNVPVIPLQSPKAKDFPR